MTKSLIITALILLAIAAMTYIGPANAVVVIGDSISAKQDSWPQILRDDYGHHVMVDAVSLRTAYGYTVPGDLYPRDHDTAIYYLGTNDMAFGSVDGFREKFNTHISTLRNKGFNVMVLIPANYSRDDLSAEIRGEIQLTCAILEQLGQAITCIDLDTIWDESLTPDGIHPEPELSQIIAGTVHGALYE